MRADVALRASFRRSMCMTPPLSLWSTDFVNGIHSFEAGMDFPA